MNKYHTLRNYLIRKFMVTIILVSVAEFAITALLNNSLFPFAMHFFFPEANMEMLSVGGMMMAFLVVFVSVFSTILQAILPAQLVFFINSLSDNVFHAFGANQEHVIEQLGIIKEIMLLLVLFGFLALIIAPYIIAAVYFSQIVVREMRIIEDDEKEKQREYAEQKNLMLSDIAHDLRTPMTTIAGYSKALTDGMVTEDKRQEYLDAIQTKTGRMNDLINLLFDYVRLDSKGFQLMRTNIDICEMIREAAAFQYQDIEDAGMELDVEIPEEKILVYADKVQFSRVISNLITNAIRHNKPGTSIGLYLLEEDETLRVIVADNGVKIPKEKADMLFEPFVMGDESRNSKGGSGLGLSIAKKVVEMHGFKIRLVQQPMIQKFPAVSEYEKMFMITIDRLT